VKTMKEQGVEARSLAYNTLKSRGACWSFGMGLGWLTSINYSHGPTQHQTTNWLVHNLSIFGVRMSHEQTRTHKTHHGLDLGEATTFPLIVHSMPIHEAHIQIAFCLGTFKWESQNRQSWDSHNFGAP
jgi:hypothetical protein